MLFYECVRPRVSSLFLSLYECVLLHACSYAYYNKDNMHARNEDIHVSTSMSCLRTCLRLPQPHFWSQEACFIKGCELLSLRPVLHFKHLGAKMRFALQLCFFWKLSTSSTVKWDGVADDKSAGPENTRSLNVALSSLQSGQTLLIPNQTFHMAGLFCCPVDPVSPSPPTDLYYKLSLQRNLHLPAHTVE